MPISLPSLQILRLRDHLRGPSLSAPYRGAHGSQRSEKCCCTNSRRLWTSLLLHRFFRSGFWSFLAAQCVNLPCLRKSVQFGFLYNLPLALCLSCALEDTQIFILLRTIDHSSNFRPASTPATYYGPPNTWQFSCFWSPRKAADSGYI